MNMKMLKAMLGPKAKQIEVEIFDHSGQDDERDETLASLLDQVVIEDDGSYTLDLGRVTLTIKGV